MLSPTTKFFFFTFYTKRGMANVLAKIFKKNIFGYDVKKNFEFLRNLGLAVWNLGGRGRVMRFMYNKKL